MTMRVGAVGFVVALLVAEAGACEGALAALDAGIYAISDAFQPANDACPQDPRGVKCLSGLEGIDAACTTVKGLMTNVVVECRHPSGPCKETMQNGTQFMNGGLVNLNGAKKACATNNASMCVGYLRACADDMVYTVEEIVLANLACPKDPPLRSSDSSSSSSARKHRRALVAPRKKVGGTGVPAATPQCMDALAVANKTTNSIMTDLSSALSACTNNGGSPACAKFLASASGLMGTAAEQFEVVKNDCKSDLSACGEATDDLVGALYVTVAHVNTAQAECPKNDLICYMEVANAVNVMIYCTADLDQARTFC